MRYKAELWQDGVVVAAVDCLTEESMKREISHYAMVYAQDGPVNIVELPRTSGRSKG